MKIQPQTFTISPDDALSSNNAKRELPHRGIKKDCSQRIYNMQCMQRVVTHR